MAIYESSNRNLDFEHTEIIGEIEIDDVRAKVLRLAPHDISDADLKEHAQNLAKVNAVPREDIPHAAYRQKLRGQVFRINEAVRGNSLIKKLALTDKTLDRIYPDLSVEEHFSAYSRRGSQKEGNQGSFTRRMSQGHVFGVELDGRIVSVQAYDHFGFTKDERPVLSFTKASTLDAYKGRKINPRLKKVVVEFAETEEGATPIFVSASVNPKHLENFEKRGWHVVPMNADIEAVQIQYQRDKDYIDKNMIPQGYKAIYADPKVDNLKWEA